MWAPTDGVFPSLAGTSSILPRLPYTADARRRFGQHIVESGHQFFVDALGEEIHVSPQPFKRIFNDALEEGLGKRHVVH